MSREERYLNALEWIHGLGRFGIKPGLQRISKLLEMLGNPHHQISFVHIGGSNGKGSTAAMIASILRSAGYRAGLYTSPYLLSFTNRMAVNGDDIEPEELVALVEQVRPQVEEISADPELGQMTEFEVVTALALTYFARREVDLVVLEVGLGGRLDATNVVTPLLSIITNISLEHTDVLGDTVGQVAREKAGIIKHGVPVLTAADDPEVLAVLKERARKLEAPFHRVYPPADNLSSVEQLPAFKRQSVIGKGQVFAYRGFNWSLDDLYVPLRGIYQAWNGATALAAVEILAGQGFRISEAAVREGLSETVWPGRLELLRFKPMLVMDGAHNPTAVKNLAEAMPEYFDYRQLILVFGALADKNIAAMLEKILPLADEVIFTRAKLPRAADPHETAAMAVEHFNFDRSRLAVIDEIGPALEKALALAGPDDLVLVTGSLYTVSDARAYWEHSSKV